MVLFLDTEFNGFGGELLSIALVPEVGDPFYRIVSDTKQTPIEWVVEHVLPIMESFIGFAASGTREQIRSDLQQYLMVFDQIHIISNCSEDISLFRDLMLMDVSGERIKLPPVTTETVRMSSRSKLPHNALADAIGRKDKFLSRKSNK